MKYTAKQLADILSGTVDGNPETTVTTFARIESGKEGALCFYANPKYEKYVYTSKASVIIVNNDFKPQEPVGATLVRVENAYTAVAQLLDYVTAERRSYRRHRGRHSVVKWSSKIGKKVYIGACSYVGEKSTIGSYTKIYEQVYVGDNVTIGEKCIIYPGVKIYAGSVIGNNVILHSGCVIGADGFGFAPQEDGTWKKIEHSGNVIIEDDVEIGANTCVDKSQIGSTIIRRGVKLDNLIQIAHNVELGKNTVSAAQAGIAGSTKIGEHCIIAGQVGISGHLTIADNTTFGPQCGILASVNEPGKKLMGTPALPYFHFMRAFAKFKASGENK